MLRRLSLGLCLVVLSTLVLGLPEVALAVPPPNDDFDNARVIRRLPYVDRRGTRQATTADDDPSCSGQGHTVWYSYRPTRGRWIRAETSRSRYDTTLSMYTGTRGNLTQLACDNNSGRGSTSLMTVRVSPNVKYYFMVGSDSGADVGRLVFSVARSKPACINRRATIVGTDGPDVLVGTKRQDVIVALRGNDSIDGVGGRDLICGNEGDDSIEARGTLEGQDGNDTITAFTDGYRRSVIRGGSGNDALSGGFGSDVISGGEGSDNLQGGVGNDVLEDDSDDVDQLSGGSGFDQLETGGGNDVVDGGSGHDVLRYSEHIRAIDANLSTGVVAFGAFTQAVTRIEGLFGTEVPDTLVGSPEGDQLFGDGGVDTISGLGGDDFLDGQDGGSTIDGGEGNDSMFGRDRVDNISGGEGSDFVSAGAGNDVVDGGPGDDLIFGDLGADTLSGGEGADDLYGDEGNDDLFGEAGEDFLKGLGGNDDLDGGDGFDWLDGGRNPDVCVNGEKLLSCETHANPIARHSRFRHLLALIPIKRQALPIRNL